MADRKQAVLDILGPVGGKAEPAPGAKYDALHSICEELIDAVHAKDVEGVCSAVRAAFEEISAEPQEEEPETSEE